MHHQYMRHPTLDIADLPPYLTVCDVASLARLAEGTVRNSVYAMGDDGHPGRGIGRYAIRSHRRLRWHRDDVLRWLQGDPKTAPAIPVVTGAET